MGSVYSAAGGKGDYDITGEVLFSVTYIGNELIVYVSKARNLAATSSKGYSNPYVKTYLLPDKSKKTKQKTSIKKKTLYPVFGEKLKVSILCMHLLTDYRMNFSPFSMTLLGQNLIHVHCG